jgi:hypothetical protein
MSQPHETSAALLAKGVIPIGYTGATLFGISMPDWAAIMAGLVSLCILIQYIWRGVCWLRSQSKPKRRPSR